MLCMNGLHNLSYVDTFAKGVLHKYLRLLSLVSAIFYQIFIFSLKDSHSKTITNVFYFIKKAPFVLEIFKFLNFFPSFPHFPDSKGQMEVESYMMS